MSFKKFSNTHNPPIEKKPDAEKKAAPMVDHPPAPGSNTPAAAKPANKP
jgi:hypothetical protein